MVSGNYRFSISTAPNGDVTIYRARLYRLPSDWTADSWAHYWDGDGMVAVYDDADYNTPTSKSNPEDTERAITAYRWDGEKGLARLARRLTAEQGASPSTAYAAEFISVGLERGVTLYALAWGGDPESKWANEIEAVYHGDIYRAEVEEYVPGHVFDEGTWITSDFNGEEWYGEEQAEAGFEREFELPEFPADRFAGSDH